MDDLLTVAPSLPSRGAWIEMYFLPWVASQKPVAPLAGSVDRNLSLFSTGSREGIMSLPSRGAWIEIVKKAESFGGLVRRSPRGERG